VLKIDEEVSEIILNAAGKKSLHLLRKTVAAEGNPDQEQEAAGEGEGAQEALRWETSDGKPVKEKEIDGLVKTLSNLKCEGYAEEKKEELGDPTFSVSLKGVRNYEVSLYGEREGKVVATSSESEDPFLLSDWKAKRIRKDLDDLMEKTD